MLCCALTPLSAAAAHPHLAAVDALAARVGGLVDEAERCAKDSGAEARLDAVLSCSLPATATTAPNTYSAALAALEAGVHPLQRPAAPIEPAPSAEPATPTALQRERALRLRAEAALDAAETRERELRRELKRRSKRKVRPKR